MHDAHVQIIPGMDGFSFHLFSKSLDAGIDGNIIQGVSVFLPSQPDLLKQTESRACKSDWTAVAQSQPIRFCFVRRSHIVQTVDIRLKPVRDDTSSAEQSVSSRVRYEMRLGIPGVSAESGSSEHRAVKLMIKV